MGEELELGQLYLKTQDGKVVSWNGISEVQVIENGGDYENAVYARLSDPVEISGTLRIDKKKSKKFLKWLKHLDNILGRRKRYYYRQKEYARRAKLKGAKYV